VTARADGSFGLTGADPVADVIARWRGFRAGLDGFTAIQRSHQVHGVRVLWHEHVAPGWHEAEDADGHATGQPGLLLSVTVADCVPVFLADRNRRVVALLHAGWKGVAGGILGVGVALLQEKAGVRASDLAAHCGVAICGKCYEVGEAVSRAVLGDRAPAGTSRLDLRAALADQAARLGISDLTITPDCTSCDEDRFYSHRASGGDLARQIGYIGLGSARD
jgi:hypothetical protein